MPTAKFGFPMTYSHKFDTLITVGGKGSTRKLLREVTQFNLKTNIWSILPSFDARLWLSSICIVNNYCLYNFGGDGSKRCIDRLCLAGSRGEAIHCWEIVAVISRVIFCDFWSNSLEYFKQKFVLFGFDR